MRRRGAARTRAHVPRGLDAGGPRRTARGPGAGERTRSVAFVTALVAMCVAALAQACTNKDVVGVQVGTVAVQPPTATLLEGDSVSLTAVVRDEQGAALEGASVSWSTEQSSIASVDSDGKVKGLAIGKVAITASFQGASGTSAINVIAGPAIEVDATEVAFHGAIGQPAPADATVEVSNNGGGTLAELEAEVQYSQGEPDEWLTGALSDDTAPTTLTLSPETAGLPVGTHVASVVLSSPSARNGPTTITVTLSITGIAVAESEDATAVAETGMTDTVTVALLSVPASDVVLLVASGDEGEVTAAPPSLTFTPDDWDQPQIVVVTGVDDALVDGAQETTVLLSVDPDASDPAYDAVPPFGVTVSNADDDGAGISLSTSAVTVDEAAGTDVVSVVLGAQPTSQVVLTVVSDDETEATVDTPLLTFTADDWSAPQTVTVIGVDDNEDDDDQTSTITVAVDVAASDESFADVAAQTLSVTTLDDDGAGFRIEPIGGSRIVGESGTTDDFTVVLQSEPVSDVFLTVTSGDTGEVTVAPAQLTFTTGNWDVPQTVTLTGEDDGLTDGDVVTTVSVAVDAAATADPAYDVLTPRTVTVTTVDDEQAQLLVALSEGATDATEGGAADSIRVRLSAEPPSPVVIDVSTDDEADATVAPGTLTFTPGNWDDAQVVVFTAVNEVTVDGTRSRTITLAVNDAGSHDAYDGIVEEVGATTIDNDQAGFTVSHTNGATQATEGGATDAVLVVLSARPLTDVVLNVSSNLTADLTVTPATLTFTSTTWNMPQAVVVTAVDDDLVDGQGNRTITVAVNDASSDDAFDPLPNQAVAATTVDDDQAGFVVDEVGGVSVLENGGTDIFTVVLTAEPGSNVVLTVTSEPDEVTVDAATLTFTPASWDTPQTVTVTGVNDDNGEGDQTTEITIAVSDGQSDDDFDGLADYDVEVQTMDDDVVGFVITEFNGTVVTEAGTTDEFGVTLNTQPLSSVVLTVTSGDTGEATVSPATLTFNTGNWQSPQPVTVRGVDDFVDDGTAVTPITVAVEIGASDPQYATVPSRVVNASTIDNDQAGFTLTETSGSTSATEGGAVDSVRVVLTARPLTNVVIGVSVDQPANRPADAGVIPASLTFTSGNWNVAQRIAFSAANDDRVDGDLQRTITFAVVDASSDNAFDGVADQSVSATTVDDDVAGFTVTASGGVTTVDESGATDDLSVVLDAQPDAPVTIGVVSDDIGEATVAPTPLGFTPENWDVAQTVIVTGVDDGALVDGNQQSTVTFSVVAGSDAAFLGVADRTEQVTTTDLDVAGFTAAAGPAGTAATEGGATGNLSVVLTARPVTDVVFDLSSDRSTDATVTPPQLRFTTINWNTPQLAVITAVDDVAVDGIGNRAVTVTVNDAASDNAFDPLSNQTVAATTVDNDIPGFTVAETDGGTTATEGGAGDSFTVVLTAQPVTQVVFDVSTDNTADATVSPTTLTFTNANWNAPQNVTFAAVNDLAVDGTQPRTITVEVNPASSDNAFDALTDAVINASTVDNDAAGFVIDEMGGVVVSESGTDDEFTVVLTAQPAADVVVTIVSDDPTEVAVNPAQITFTGNNWDVPRTVTATGVDDLNGDGDQTTTVNLTVTSADLLFDALPDQSLVVTTTDDDGIGVGINEVGSTRVNESGSGSTDDFEVVLTAQPIDPVVLTIVPSDPGEAVTDLSELTFTNTNWDSPQTIIVTAVDDDLDDGNQDSQVTISVDPGRSDAAYDTVSARVVIVTTVDDDIAGFTLTQSGGGTQVTEAAGVGNTDTFTAVLTAQPATNVVLTVTSGDTGEATVNPATLTFTNQNWNAAQTVTVTGADDDLVDGNPVTNVTVAVNDAASDNAFDGVANQTVAVTTVDNDVAGFTIAHIGGTTEATEAGAPDTITVVLAAQPVDAVTFNVTTNLPADGTLSPPLVAFDDTNWNIQQRVIFTAINDIAADGTVAHTLTVAVAAGSDAAFLGLLPQTLPATTLDDDGGS